MHSSLEYTSVLLDSLRNTIDICLEASLQVFTGLFPFSTIKAPFVGILYKKGFAVIFEISAKATTAFAERLGDIVTNISFFNNFFLKLSSIFIYSKSFGLYLVLI